VDAYVEEYGEVSGSVDHCFDLCQLGIPVVDHDRRIGIPKSILTIKHFVMVMHSCARTPFVFRLESSC